MTTETLTETRPTETRERTPADVLLAAARYIEEHGWTQGCWLDEDGAVCMDGALAAVITGHPHGMTVTVDEPSQRLYYAAVGRLYPRHATPVSYNDTPGRTEAEVLAALRAAAGAS